MESDRLILSRELLDVVVFSRDRNKELAHSIKTWQGQPFRFIILHNSKKALPIETTNGNIEYRHLPGVSYGERAGIATELITSKFSAILADDEMLVESGVKNILNYLEENKGIASAGGKVFGIHKYGKFTTGAFAYRNMYNYSNLEKEIIPRLNYHLVQPINQEMPRASMYRIMKSENLRSILQLFSQVTFIESPYVYEVVGEFALAASGPTTTLDVLYWIRNWQNRMIQHDDWNRSMSFTTWWTNSRNLEKRERLIDILSEFANIKPETTATILSKYLERRALYEATGNKQLGTVKSLLSRVKQKISDAPRDIFDIIEAEYLANQKIEKTEIAFFCNLILND